MQLCFATFQTKISHEINWGATLAVKKYEIVAFLKISHLIVICRLLSCLSTATVKLIAGFIFYECFTKCT